MIESEWNNLADRFRQHFGEEKVSEDENVLKFQGATSSFKVTREGGVEASMPLHSFRTDEFERIEFGEEAVRVAGDGLVYDFRK